ncbi:MAG: DUF2849 domain-containing protein [Myxococcales bacterium]|nr:DUF2849 domain-containing protein [Myxococcales bacterium]MDD9972349.1 DUF2849 domain-containing protein [Myxococcales bacterium]
MSKSHTSLAITAARTDDGAPVYWTPEGGWSRALADAQVFADAKVAEGALGQARGQERQVCDPYTMKVSVVDGRPQPLTARERIRCEGPTTRLRRPDPPANPTHPVP